VDVVDAVGEGLDALGGVEPLSGQVRGAESEGEGGRVDDRGGGAGGGVDAGGDRGRGDLECKAGDLGPEGGREGPPPAGEVVEALVHARLLGRREEVEHVPDARAREAVDDGDAELPGGLGGVDHLLRGPAADALRVSVAPEAVGEDGLVPVVDRIADALPDEVVGDGVADEAVALELGPLGVAVAGFGEGAVDLEVVAPAGEFGAVVAEAPDLREELLAGEVGPLAGEEGDWAWHLGLLADGQDAG